MSKIIILKGLPASGKSTWAKAQKGFKRVNKDDLRAMLDNSVWSKGNEKFVLMVRDFIIDSALQLGKNVIVDDTNFDKRHEKRFCEIAKNHNAAVEEKFFDTPLEECIVRDAKREKPVGEQVIRGMYNKYLKDSPGIPAEDEKYANPEGKPLCVICDIDGTIAEMNGRGPFEWHRVGEDLPKYSVINVVRSLAKENRPLIFFSGRDSACRNETKQWLDTWFVDIPFELYMRPEGDMRKDSIIKKELFDNVVRGRYGVECVFDDRDQVVKLWRDMGLQCFQVNYGAF